MAYQNTRSFQAFVNSPFRSTKHKSYFNVYDALLKEYIGKEITFVEVGVLNGGSLFMWRNFFGEKARIIGIEINKSAEVWKDYGFEIYIGSQSDPNFWNDIFERIGKVDIVLDDGGHTYQQQIITVESALENIKPGGKIIVEDTYTSYQKEYGYPSNHSFIKYAANLVDGMNLRAPKIKTIKNSNKAISNISFYESIVSFSIASKEDLDLAEGISNNGKILEKEAWSLRYADKPTLTRVENLILAFKALQRIPIVGDLLKSTGVLLTKKLKHLINKVDNRKLRKYFKY
jgi:hypothetical protein